MLIEFEDGTVKNLHIVLANKILKSGKGVRYEGERMMIEETEEPKEKPKVKRTKKTVK